MRMWMLDPEMLCRKHLLGEHVEIHMLVGSLLRSKNIMGHLKKGQLFPSLIWERHDALVKEMKSRGYNHKSPLPPKFDISNYENYLPNQDIINRNRVDLTERCPECLYRFKDILKRALERNI